MSDRAISEFTDSAGVHVFYIPLKNLKPGDKIVGGWKPWLVFESLEHDPDEEKYRMVFEGGHRGGWLDENKPIPVEVETG